MGFRGYVIVKTPNYIVVYTIFAILSMDKWRDSRRATSKEHTVGDGREAVSAPASHAGYERPRVGEREGRMFARIRATERGAIFRKTLWPTAPGPEPQPS